MAFKPPKPHEAEEWIEREMLKRIAAIPCVDQDEALYTRVRREVTLQYYSTKPTGDVLVQLTIDRFINRAKVRRDEAIQMLA